MKNYLKDRKKKTRNSKSKIVSKSSQCASSQERDLSEKAARAEGTAILFHLIM